VHLKVDLSAFGQSIRHDGPLEDVPSIDLAFGDETAFDPFLVGGEVTVEADIPASDLATIPLAAALGIPGVTGDLVINVGGTLRSTFSGTCASVAGGEASYQGVTRTSGQLVIRPRLEISLGPISETLEPFDIPVDIPELELPIDLGRVPVAGGGPGGGGGSMASSGACDPSASGDGGPGGPGGRDGGPGNDGAPTSGDGGAGGDGGSGGDGPGPDGVPGSPEAVGQRCDGSDDPCGLEACVVPGNSSLRAGVCTATCAAAADCGAGNDCVPGVDASLCVRLCGPGTYEPCGAGTSCDLLRGICIGSCQSDDDCNSEEAGLTGRYCNRTLGQCLLAGNASGAVGDPCASDADCPRNGYCLTEAQGFPGGYCLIVGCEYGDIVCDAGSLCGGLAEDGSTACFRSCASDGDCRAGYVCQGDEAIGRACVPPA
jgi:hypothetical protein